jgi:hypothetical protein
MGRSPRPAVSAPEDPYDRILVYSEPDVFDLVAEIGLSARAGAKVRHTSNALLEAPRPASQPLRLDGRSVVAAELESLLAR